MYSEDFVTMRIDSYSRVQRSSHTVDERNSMRKHTNPMQLDCWSRDLSWEA